MGKSTTPRTPKEYYHSIMVPMSQTPLLESVLDVDNMDIGHAYVQILPPNQNHKMGNALSARDTTKPTLASSERK
jgi:hypothetical protein